MEKDKLSAWVQTYSGCDPCHMANVREALPKASKRKREKITHANLIDNQKIKSIGEC